MQYFWLTVVIISALSSSPPVSDQKLFYMFVTEFVTTAIYTPLALHFKDSDSQVIIQVKSFDKSDGYLMHVDWPWIPI